MKALLKRVRKQCYRTEQWRNHGGVTDLARSGHRSVNEKQVEAVVAALFSADLRQIIHESGHEIGLSHMTAAFSKESLRNEENYIAMGSLQFLENAAMDTIQCCSNSLEVL
ncbi:hypothetical protein Trydic_g16097 [Trypoxylus dichotomus]